MMGHMAGRIGGVSSSALAARFGTPLYAYDGDALRGRYRRFADAFSRRPPLICYALKANPLKALARILAREGAGCDVVSGGELARALAAGFRPDRIVFSGVGKSEDEMRSGLRAGIKAFNVESAAELALLARVAGRFGRPARFAVRINPGIRAGGHAHIVTGVAATKFGVESSEALALYRNAARDRRLRAVGVQCHLGSQILSPEPYRRALAALLRIADAVGPLEHVDLGGGMGVGYDGGAGLSPEALARRLLPALRGRRESLVLEPGRWLAAPVGTLLCRVLFLKSSSRRRFVVVDAGMNDLLRPALYSARHRIAAVRPSRGSLLVDVVGPVCETADYLARGVRLPRLEPGDVLAVLDAGAYGSSMGSQYNSRPRPAEVLIEGRRARLVRRRERLADLTRHEL
ncbi:MAG: diaminopimelate decarboxylase [Elusimicrobia bacterium]|nr:diaminopimelate decarboxylase [Elusimicrobiota bacterium]